MSEDVPKFLEELAAFMAAAASVEFAATPRALFISELVEADSTLAAATPAPASVLSAYAGGSVPYVPTPTLPIQCRTIGLPRDDKAAWTRARALHGSLRTAGGVPLRMQALTSFRINAIANLTMPGQIGRDDKDRVEIVFNFEARFVPTS